MTPERDIALLNRHAGEYVRAQLLERIDVAYARRTDDLWVTFMAAEVAGAQAKGLTLELPAHAHWRWEKKVALVGHLLPYPTIAVEFEGDAQGLMLLETDGEFARIPEQNRKPLVYVVFLATAPWNLSAVVSRPRFGGVGTVLLRASVELSVELGFKGRIGLHALPQSEPFYARLGMTDLGPDPAKKLRYYEMTPEQAEAFLR